MRYKLHGFVLYFILNILIIWYLIQFPSSFRLRSHPLSLDQCRLCQLLSRHLFLRVPFCQTRVQIVLRQRRGLLWLHSDDIRSDFTVNVRIDTTICMEYDSHSDMSGFQFISQFMLLLSSLVCKGVSKLFSGCPCLILSLRGTDILRWANFDTDSNYWEGYVVMQWIFNFTSTCFYY